MDALELALRCSSLLTGHQNGTSSVLEETVDFGMLNLELRGRVVYQNDSDVEQHFRTDLEDVDSLTVYCETTRLNVTIEEEDGTN